MDVLVDRRVEDLLKARGDQCRLGRLGVVGEEVEVTEAAQAGRAVRERDFRPLHEQQRPVVRGRA